MKVFAFIDEQKTEFDIKTLCTVCGVPRSAFYEWASSGPTDALWDEAILANQIYEIWARSKGRYGVPRVAETLRRQGQRVNRKRVGRLMTQLGLAGRAGRRKVRTTRVDRNATPAPDLVDRAFEREILDSLWIGDITYIPTDQGWLYLSSVLDACSRRLLGWSIADHLRTDLCLDALHAAAATRGRARFAGVVFHSDRG